MLTHEKVKSKHQLSVWNYKSPQEYDVKLIRNIKYIKEKFEGLYFLFNEGKLYYVGQSNNVISRIKTHRAKKTFDSYSYIKLNRTRSQRMVIEAMYIKAYSPVINIPKGCFLDFPYNWQDAKINRL